MYVFTVFNVTYQKGLKTSSKRVTAGATGDFIGNKIAYRITKISKTLPQINSETIANEHDIEIPKERYITSEERQKLLMSWE